MKAMEIQIIKFSRKIKKFREEKNFTQEELAEKLGISRQSIISLERGRCLPSLPLALSFSQFFELPLEKIFLDSDEQEEREINKMTYDLMPNHPIQEVSSLHEAIDRVFSESQEVAKTPTLPLVNVFEKNGQIVITADVPGIAEEDLNIDVTDDSVTISGTRKTEEESTEEDFYRHEVDYGSFSRTIALPNLVDKEKAEAELKNGILTISLDKEAEVKPKVTKIKIKKN